ncbi:MAG: hypothetical protein METHAR1v1_1560009 [Methanothrix sp.]|jgi:hypothetical protein|nr:MAG: hypothetical protein METHAR1v1_1560009 [Methanothrix sp.]
MPLLSQIPEDHEEPDFWTTVGRRADCWIVRLRDAKGDIMEEESRKAVMLSDMNKLLSEGEVRSLEGLSIEGDIEIELDVGGPGLGPILMAGFGQEIVKTATQLLNVSKALGYPADNLLVPPEK